MKRVLVKLGLKRLEFVRKMIIAMGVLGVVMATEAAVFYPGLTFECGPRYNKTLITRRNPLHAVFLLDASGSVDDAQWSSEKDATTAIIKEFDTVYSNDSSGQLHVGVAQFSTDATKELDITNNLASVYAHIPG